MTDKLEDEFDEESLISARINFFTKDHRCYIYFWKAGDTRISEIKFAGTTGPTGTSGTRYIRYPRYLKTPNAWFYDKPDVNEITDLTGSGKLNQVPGICD